MMEEVGMLTCAEGQVAMHTVTEIAECITAGARKPCEFCAASHDAAITT